MKVTLRIVLSIFIAISLIVLLFTLFQVQQEKARLKAELEHRVSLLAESLEESVAPLVGQGNLDRLKSIVGKFSNRQRLEGVAIYDTKDNLIAATPDLAPMPPTIPTIVTDAMNANQAEGLFITIKDKRRYLYVLPINRDGNVAGALVIFNDATYIQERLFQIWKNNFVRLLVQAFFISLITMLVIRWSISGPIARLVEWMKGFREDKAIEPFHLPKGNIFEPLTKEITHMVRSIMVARSAAEEEARLRHTADSLWTAKRLTEHIRSLLKDKNLFVVSNREPYMHVRSGDQMECIIPASGLVTAVEPVLEACGGLWIANGSGEADKEVVDQQDKIRVPPEEPLYTLKRVWLTTEEEEGYYFGFSNEGLWPLCHIAHTRPIFRRVDWNHYQTVNEKFARAVLEEIYATDEPLVLVQDYHFALLPRLIKEERPDARIALFWHIPWPNPESFGICPWQREILDGMLGADLIGFHIQLHCNNFLDTVDKALESRIDWEHFAVKRKDHTTYVKPFPISIAYPGDSNNLNLTRIKKGDIFKQLGIKSRLLGVGVDRLDYTKGILERLRAIERFLDKYPDYKGKFTFVELGAPSRTLIKRYQELVKEIEAEVERINARFQTGDWKPIILLKRHHSHKEIKSFYESADVCLVTSLHDGMNLVAKEYVAAREDEQGVLILSRFTGASRELRDALIVNPYNIEQMADALRTALEMDEEEQRARMQKMRESLRSNNIYRWAANLIEELAKIRIEY